MRSWYNRCSLASSADPSSVRSLCTHSKAPTSARTFRIKSSADFLGGRSGVGLKPNDVRSALRDLVAREFISEKRRETIVAAS